MQKVLWFGPVLGALLAATAAQAQPTVQNPLPVIKTYGAVGGWTIMAATVEGQHMACSAAPPGEAGTRAAFESTSEGLTVLVATATKGAEGDESKGSYDIDGKVTRVPFYRRENDRIMGFLKEPHAKQLAAGKAKTMTVTVGSEKTVLPLEGVAAALSKANRCIDREGKP